MVDATYQPVDKLGKVAGPDRDAVIARDYPLLFDDLTNLIPNRFVPLVLIKANVCRLLEPRLSDDGFVVLNGEGLSIFQVTGSRRISRSSLLPSYPVRRSLCESKFHAFGLEWYSGAVAAPCAPHVSD